MNSLITDNYYKITGCEGLKINYLSDYQEKKVEELKKMYKSTLKKDLILGKTSLGIHHDDLEFYLDDMNLKIYGSEGQQKNVILFLKYSQI